MASQTDRERLKQLQKSRIVDDANFVSAETVVRQHHSQFMSFILPSDAAASTETTFPLFRADRACKIKSVRLGTTANVTADDTNYKTVALTYDDDAGGSATTVASQTTKITGGSGNITANRSVVIAVTAANAYIAANKAIHWAVTHTGTGVQMPVTNLLVEVEWF